MTPQAGDPQAGDPQAGDPQAGDPQADRVPGAAYAPRLTNVTVSSAVRAVGLFGDGAKATVPVPEQGTVIVVGMYFFTK
jgi:hypothetical protein